MPILSSDERPWSYYGYGGAAGAAALSWGAIPFTFQQLDYVLGKPFALRQYAIDQGIEWQRIATGYQARTRSPNYIPSADSIIQAYRRGFLDRFTTRKGLNAHGISWGEYPGVMPGEGEPLSRQNYQALADIWDKVSAMHLSMPGPADVANLYARGRLTAEQFVGLGEHLDADWSKYSLAARASYNVPGPQLLWQMRALDKITEDQYLKGMQAAGWWDDEWRGVAIGAFPVLSLPDILRCKWRGYFRGDEEQKYLKAAGYVDARTAELQASLLYTYPSLGDIISYAVRDVWNQDVVSAWGYDDEFPEEVAYFAGKTGSNWGERVRYANGRLSPLVTWPRADWRAHWRPFPLGSAYDAYHRFRGNRLWRYRDQFPDIQPFTQDLLKNVIKVADYPPKARTWLAALATPVLPIVYIRMLVRYGIRDRAWATEQLKDRGYLQDDIDAQLDLIERWEDIRDQQAIRNQARRLATQTAREVVAGFTDGLMPRETAAQRLSELGWGATMVTQSLNLAESQVLRATIRQLLGQVRRSYLSGALTQPALTAALAQIQIAEPRRSQLVQRWTVQLSLERRQLATGQVTAAVAQGALTPAAALARLENLHWTTPDAALLTSQAEARYLQAQARATQKLVSQQKAREKALVAAQKSAAQAVRQAQNQLRRITPPARLKRLYCLGIRRADWIQARLVAIGYDTISALDQLLEWNETCLASPPVETPAVKTIQQLLRRQTPRATVKEMWQNGVVTDEWARRRLNDLGYNPESVANIIALWDATRGKKSGPKTPG